MSMVCRVGSASTADHFRWLGRRVRRGVAGSGVAARSGTVQALVGTRRRRPGERSAGGDGGGGLHWVALRGRGDHRCGLRGALAEPADTQAARGPKRRAKTDRSDARVVARVVAAWRSARVVDPADGGVGVARTGAALQVAGRSAFGVDPADPRRVVPARGRRSRRPRSDPRRLGSSWPAHAGLSPAARQRIRAGYTMIDATDAEAVAAQGQP